MSRDQYSAAVFNNVDVAVHLINAAIVIARHVGLKLIFLSHNAAFLLTNDIICISLTACVA